MKKSKKMGFVLAETIAISTVVLGALIFIYVQFVSINNSYYTSFKYNTVDNLYKVNNLVEFLEDDYEEQMLKDLNASEHGYLDITNISKYYIEYELWNTLVSTSNIKQVIFTFDNTEFLKENLSNISSFSENMKKFISKTSSQDSVKYRVVVEFENDEFATLKVELEAPSYSVTQLITNGDFTDGTTGWSSTSTTATLTVNDGILTFGNLPTSNWASAFGNSGLISNDSTKNHNFYLAMKSKLPSNSYTIGFCLKTSGDYPYMAPSAKYIANQYSLSSVIEMPSNRPEGNQDSYFCFSKYLVTSSTETVYVDYALAIDLTESFEGAEVSKEWLDNNITYFDGTKNIQYKRF